MIPGNPSYDRGQGFSRYSPPQKFQVHIHTHVQCFQKAARASHVAQRLHNSADRGISKFVYLPLQAILQDLQKIATAAHRANDTVILCMDANETIPEVAPIIAKGILKFSRDAGLVDTLSTLHGHCPHKSCEKSSGSPIDFVFCSPDLIPHLRVGMLNEAQGSDSDHLAFSIDINEHSLWQKPAIVNPLILQRGFSTTNSLKTREFVMTLYDILKTNDIELIMTQAQEAIKAYEVIDRIGGLLDEADRVMTNRMMEAESAVRPLQKASSYSWRPKLAMRQRKAALGRKYEIAMRKLMIEALRSTVEAEARAIDPTWELPLIKGEVLKNWAEALTKQARKAKRNQQKLRKVFLEKRLRESVSEMAP